MDSIISISLCKFYLVSWIANKIYIFFNFHAVDFRSCGLIFRIWHPIFFFNWFSCLKFSNRIIPIKFWSILDSPSALSLFVFYYHLKLQLHNYWTIDLNLARINIEFQFSLHFFFYKKKVLHYMEARERITLRDGIETFHLISIVNFNRHSLNINLLLFAT